MLVVGLMGLFIQGNRSKSTNALFACCICTIIWLVSDAVSYSTSGMGIALPLLWLANFLSYVSGCCAYIAFTLYCWAIVGEETEVNPWLYRLPIALMCVSIVFICLGILSGECFWVQDGTVIATGKVPLVSSIINFVCLIYLPVAAFTKRSKIGARTVFLLGLFGVIPLLCVGHLIATGGWDLTPLGAAFSVMIVCVLLQNDLYYAMQQTVKSRLQRENARLEKTAIRREAYIEDVTALNVKLADVENAVSNAGLGMWHIVLKDDAEPRMQASDKMLELLGISKHRDMTEEEVFVHWHERIMPDALLSVQASVAEMLEGRFSENTYLWKHPQKGLIYVRCGGTAATGEDGEKILSGYHSDVTEIVMEDQRRRDELAIARDEAQEARAEAEAANAAKTSFLFNMSHDIRTPMNAIMGYTALMKKYRGDAERFDDYLEKIRLSSETLLSIINNVLEMARIEKGAIELCEEPWVVGGNTDELNRVYKPLMDEKGIEFTTSVNAAGVAVLCDRVKAREIMDNLVSNALKYTEPGGKVNMALEVIPDTRAGWAVVRTVVSDTGIGMSEEFLPHLFDEFARESNTTANKVQGTGLGMSIVKRLVDLMGGSIYVESEKGVGTTFTLNIPHRLVEVDEASQEEEPEIDLDIFRGKKLLLAEDNDLNAEIAMELLGAAGFVVERAVDGSVAVDMVNDRESGYFDAVLMDVQMPQMNGYEATRAIRDFPDPGKSHIPIIAMTANAFEEDRRDAIMAGMDGHVAKPIDMKGLIAALASVIS